MHRFRYQLSHSLRLTQTVWGGIALSPHFDKLIQRLAGQFGTALQEAIEAQQHTFVDVVAIAERAHQIHVLCHHFSEEASKPRHRAEVP